VSEPWCALLNALIVALVTGFNGVQLHRQSEVKRELHEFRNGSGDE
jgi:hypothetical protein